ncbi:UNVERIFIED_CONTAM: hypothetical protein HHA_292150 [Hammondia hammondi]|eukprot:XP_008887893.1 hypothetical protein HHA_292150 [Hammondia hammondi]
MQLQVYIVLGVALCFARCCCAEKLGQRQAVDQSAVPLLRSPLYEPLSGLAVQIKELQAKVPQLGQFIDEGTSATIQYGYVSTLIHWLSSHMKHVMALMSAPPLGTKGADLAGIFVVMRRKLEQVIAGLHVLINVEGGSRLGERAAQLRTAAEKALQAVMPLRTALLENGKDTIRHNAQELLPSKVLYEVLGQIEEAHSQPRTTSMSFVETVNSKLQEARTEVKGKLRKAVEFLKTLKHCVAADAVGLERAAALRTFMETTHLHKVPDSHTVENSAAITTTALEKLSPETIHGQNAPAATMSWPTAVTNLNFLHTAIVPELTVVVKRIEAAEKMLAGLRRKLRRASFLHQTQGREAPMAVETKLEGSLEEDKKDDDGIFAVIGGIPFFDF